MNKSQFDVTIKRAMSGSIRVMIYTRVDSRDLFDHLYNYCWHSLSYELYLVYRSFILRLHVCLISLLLLFRTFFFSCRLAIKVLELCKLITGRPQPLSKHHDGKRKIHFCVLHFNNNIVHDVCTNQRCRSSPPPTSVCSSESLTAVPPSRSHRCP